jgi:hypothetical protein
MLELLHRREQGALARARQRGWGIAQGGRVGYLCPIAKSLELIVGVAVRGCCCCCCVADGLDADPAVVDALPPADAAGTDCCDVRAELMARRRRKNEE